MSLEKAARAIDRAVPVGLSIEEGVFAIPIKHLLALREALDHADMFRAHCLGCGAALEIGEPVKRHCDRPRCRELNTGYVPEEVGP